VPLHTRERCQMRAPATTFPDDRQCQSLNAIKQALSRGVGCRALRVPGIQPRQRRPFGGHRVAADDSLHPDISRHPHRRRSAAIAPPRVLPHPFGVPHHQQPLHPVSGQDRLHGFLPRGPCGAPPLAPPPLVERGQRCLCLGQPRAPCRLPGTGPVAQAPHQPVAAQVRGIDPLAGPAAQGLELLLGPGLSVVQALIRLGEDMGQLQRRGNRSLVNLERSRAEWSGTGLWL
jgi:hypothetical protein